MRRLLFMALIFGMMPPAFGVRAIYELKSDKIGFGTLDGKDLQSYNCTNCRIAMIVLEYKKQISKPMGCFLVSTSDDDGDWIGTGRRFSTDVDENIVNRYFTKDAPPFILSSQLKNKKEIALLIPPPGMVLIPGGTFMMGCTEMDRECAEDEYPPHIVTLRQFFMDKTEVTVEAYQACVNAGGCTISKTKSDDPYCNCGFRDRNDHPINCVKWEQAKSYCQWAGKRLPSEAEWEYAARGGHSDWKYPWGEGGNITVDCSRAVMPSGGLGGCGKGSTWPVGSKGEYGFGLNDMAGNVWEWVEDCYHNDYKDASRDGQAWITEHCNKRVLRGGSWDNFPSDFRVSFRYRFRPGYRDFSEGFRCAKSIEKKHSPPVSHPQFPSTSY
jgi:formylglycine-generating enzyme required for sulfatase activity